MCKNLKIQIPRYKTGQSTVEYIVLVTAVILVMILFLVSSNKAPFQARLNGTLDEVSKGMGNVAVRLTESP